MLVITLLLSMMPVMASANGDNVSFLVIADLHSMSNFVQNENTPQTVLVEPWQVTEWNNLNKALKNIRDNYVEDTDIVLAPGDVVSFGGWRDYEKFTSKTGLSDQNEAVYAAAVSSYNKTNELYQGAGFTTYLPCIGDHEIGGNEGFRVSGSRSKLTSISTFRRGWIDSFMTDENGSFRFNDAVSDAPSRPPESSGFHGTSFGNNSLFISVDVFTRMTDGTTDYYDRLNGYGGEGAITCTLEGLHATWFESVLKAARDDSSVKHIFVQGHVPIMHPVRKVACSGQFLDDQTDSTFWRLMEEYNVDVYFAGEVHAVTVSKSKAPGSKLLQIVTRGNFFSSFLTVDTTDDTFEIKNYRGVGPTRSFVSDYVENGLLKVDKSNPSNPQISSSGELEILDDADALLHFDFEGVHKIDSRPIYGMLDDGATYQVVGGINSTESIHNMGSFGRQYDAQIANIELVPGRIANSFAGKFSSSSRFGVFSVGPYTAGIAHSISLWIKTSEASKRMVLFYYGPKWKESRKDSLHIMLDNGELRFQFSDSGNKFKLTEEKMLADNQWHHIAAVMPFNSCKYSQLQFYVDGVLYTTKQTHGSDNHLFFHTMGWLSIGGYGYREQFENDGGLLHMFEGEIDDVMVWSKPLQKQEILMLWDQSSSSPPTPTSGHGDDSKVIVCGRGAGCAGGDRDVALVDEIHKVRCCRDCVDCSSPWKQKCPGYNPGIFAASKIGGDCKQGTFLEALNFCGSVPNGRLCTSLEVQNSCAQGTGCQFDREMVWTCAYDGHQCTDDTECCGSCVSGKCEGGNESRPQDQNSIPSLKDGIDVPIMTDGSSDLSLFWIFTRMSLLMTACICMGFLF